MPMLQKSRSIENFGVSSNIVYCVLCDHNLSTDGGIIAFYKSVHKGRVKDIIWVKLPLTHQAASPDDGAELMDGLVQAGLENLAAKWKASDYYGSAMVKLIIAPCHGTNRGKHKGRLFWSNQHPVHGPNFLTQELSSALYEASYLGFHFVILLYCHTSEDLRSLPSTFDEAVGQQSDMYEVRSQSIVVCGFEGIKWAPDCPLQGDTSALAFLGKGAPISKDCKVARRYVTRARVNIIVPKETKKRVQTLDPLLVATDVCFVGPIGDSSRYKQHTVKAFAKRVDQRTARRENSDLEWRPQAQCAKALLIFVKGLRKGENVRVAFYAHEGGYDIGISLWCVEEERRIFHVKDLFARLDDGGMALKTKCKRRQKPGRKTSALLVPNF